MAYATAALLGTLVAAPLAVTFASGMFNLFVHPAHPRVRFMVYIGLETAMFGAAILWIINDRRRALRARARMHRAELERIAAEKRSIESDLQAMQARVEPQFLFNTLSRVRMLDEQDSAKGEHMLDELIAYLRAAMPRMRDTSSTVHQEIELVRAYLAIVKVRLDERFTYDIDASPQAYGIRMPPMMLLPLVDDAMGRDADDASAPRAIRVAVEAGASQLILRVAERDRRAPPAHRHALDAIRERLDALYGGAAKVACRPAGEYAAEVFVEIPIETPATAARVVTLRGTDPATGSPGARPAPL